MNDLAEAMSPRSKSPRAFDDKDDGDNVIDPPAATSTSRATTTSKRKVGFFSKIAQTVSSTLSATTTSAHSSGSKGDGEEDEEGKRSQVERQRSIRKTRGGSNSSSNPNTTPANVMGRKTHRKTKSAGLEELEREEEQRRVLLNSTLSASERAFLPASVQNFLLRGDALPECPLLEESQGVVLFADISGFTVLGKLLRQQFPALEAASRLAKRIGDVLQRLTTVCVHQFGGDVVKFAGDALLCVFEQRGPARAEEDALNRAKACAVAMLVEVKAMDAQLGLHGGIATGKLLHIHLGDNKKEAVWYVLTGDAMVRAANLVALAERGKILHDTGSGGVEELTTESQIAYDKPAPITAVFSQINKSRVEIAPKGRAYIPNGLRNILMSDRAENGEMRSRVAVLFATLPSLSMSAEEIASNTLSDARKTLLNNTFCHISQIVRESGGEFRDLLFDDKGCVFIAVFGAYAVVEMAELKALKAAMRMNQELEVEQLKIGVSVGTCYVGLVGNESRCDMNVMGNEVNMAARYMSKADEGSILCSEQIQRATRDFFQFEPIKLDLKKRALVASPANAPLLSDSSNNNSSNRDLKATSSFHRFELYDNDLLDEAASGGFNGNSAGGKGLGKRSQSVTADPNGLVTGYRPVKETAKRGSFYATYRYVDVIPDEFFQGRKEELKRLQAHILRSTQNKTFSVAFLAGPRGYGKSWLVRELRRKMTATHLFALSVAFELDVATPLYAIRQLVEVLFEAFDGMPKKRAQALVDKWMEAGIKLDYVALERLLPYVAQLVPEKSTAAAAAKAGSSRNAWGVSLRFGNKSLRRNANGGGGGVTGGGSFTQSERALLDSSDLMGQSAAAMANKGGSFHANYELGTDARLKHELSDAALPTSRPQPSDAISEAPPVVTALFLGKTRAVSLLEEPIEEEMVPSQQQQHLLYTVRASESAGSDANVNGSPVLHSTLHHHQHPMARVLSTDMGGGNASFSTGSGGNGDLTSSRRRLFSSFRSSSVISRARAGSLLSASPATQALPPQPPPPAASASAAAPMASKKSMRKSYAGEKNIVLKKNELDGLVKFVAALFDLAATEAGRVEKKGLVIVIEDIQWLDIVSMQVLNEMLAQDLFPSSVYLLLSMRNASESQRAMEAFTRGVKKTDTRTLLEQELRDLCHDIKTMEVFEVDVLTRAETDQLVSKLLVKAQGESVSDEVKEDIFSSTGGMPNAVADVIDLIFSKGVPDGCAVYLDPHSNQWRWKLKMPGKEQGGRSVLAVARQAYLSRIDHLDLETRDFLKIAACLGGVGTGASGGGKFKAQDIVAVLERDLEARKAGGLAHNAESTLPSVKYVAFRLQYAVENGLLVNPRGLFNAMTLREEWAFASSAIREAVLELVPADRLREIRSPAPSLLIGDDKAADHLAGKKSASKTSRPPSVSMMSPIIST